MKIPTHKISDHAENGISIRMLTPDISVPDVTPLHRDDYYAFCFLSHGEFHMNVDFQRVTLQAGHIGCMLPGQIHQYISARDTAGWIMFIDSVHLSDDNLMAMRRFALNAHTLTIDERRTNELSHIFPMLQERINSSQAKDFSWVITDIFTEVIDENDMTERLTPRHRDVMLRFVQLVEQHIHESRQPSFYAGKLNITTGYLNEIVTATTGQ